MDLDRPADHPTGSDAPPSDPTASSAPVSSYKSIFGGDSAAYSASVGGYKSIFGGKPRDNTTPSTSAFSMKNPPRKVINMISKGHPGAIEEIDKCDDLAAYDEVNETWIEAPAHYGAVRVCQAKMCGGGDKDLAIRVCEGCVETTHRTIKKNWPLLLEEKWLPMCRDCTAKSQKALENKLPFVGCTCPHRNLNSVEERKRAEKGHSKFLCCGCRMRELNRVRDWYEIEWEHGRTVARPVVENGVTKWVSKKRLCDCGEPLPDESRQYDIYGTCTVGMRCGGCRGVSYDGPPDPKNAKYADAIIRATDTLVVSSPRP
jgi:hypothetical protein